MAPQSTDKNPLDSRGETCPSCKNPSLPSTHSDAPFCSRRCALLDLGRWFKGDYRIPAEETPNDVDAGGEF